MSSVPAVSVGWHETRGYWLPNDGGSPVSGWFSLANDGFGVVRRVVRGRNRYRFSDVAAGVLVADPSACPGWCRFGVAS